MPEYISAEGLEKLKAELQSLKTTRRQDIAMRLEHAKSLGDLSENAEYQETKEEQTLLEHQIAELEEMIRNAVVIKASVVVLAHGRLHRTVGRARSHAHAGRARGHWRAPLTPASKSTSAKTLREHAARGAANSP